MYIPLHITKISTLPRIQTLTPHNEKYTYSHYKYKIQYTSIQVTIRRKKLNNLAKVIANDIKKIKFMLTLLNPKLNFSKNYECI